MFLFIISQSYSQYCIGGKHGFYEGGIRTEAFVWAGSETGLIADRVRGSSFHGLMHVADWKATYAIGVVGLNVSIALEDGGPFANESVNQWNAIVKHAGASPSPRKEILHSIHSPKYYPGNCSIEVWGGRNCPVVITVGDMKYMKGYVGDPRRLEMDEATTHVTEFGLSGGECGIDDGASNGSRCDAPGKKGHPKPQPNDPGGCLYGCLFNVTEDVGEQHNLINNTAYASLVSIMETKLKVAGSIAPPWFQAPEVSNMSTSALGEAFCEAAKRSGSVQPIDF